MEEIDEFLDYKYDSDFDKLLKATIDIGNILQGKQINDSEQNIYYAEGLGQKILHHIISAKFLSQGYQLASPDSIYNGVIDFSSMMILTRAAFETYLTFHYLFINPPDDAIRKFRFLCWNISGFLDRADHNPKEPEHRNLKIAEQALLQQDIELLKNNSYFKSITIEAQKRALIGEWRLFDRWSDLALKAGFNKEYFQIHYKYLCGFSHSSRLSINQIQQTKTVGEQSEMAKSSKAILILILAKYIYDYIELMPLLHSVKDDKKIYPLILEWKRIAEMIKNGKQPDNE